MSSEHAMPVAYESYAENTEREYVMLIALRCKLEFDLKYVNISKMTSMLIKPNCKLIMKVYFFISRFFYRLLY